MYEESEDYGLGKVSIKLLIMPAPDELKEHEAVFCDIQDTLIPGISDAKYFIWTAATCFTHDAISRELLLKRQAGLDVRVIISDEEVNNKLLSGLKENFGVAVIPRHGKSDLNCMDDIFLHC